MKNAIIFSMFFLGFFTKNQAQETKNFIQETEIGLHITPFYVFTTKPEEGSFEMSLSLDASICTNSTHHHIGFDFISNSVEFLNGIFLNDTWDSYIYFSKSINSKEFILSTGIEKYYEGEFLNKTFFLDFGTSDFKYYSGAIGIIFELPLITFKRE